jgi:hypothetical protein
VLVGLVRERLQEETPVFPQEDGEGSEEPLPPVRPDVAEIDGKTVRFTARDEIVLRTAHYAKRQRTWFRARMKNWVHLDAATL